LYYHCPDCGWTTVYDLEGKLISTYDEYDPVKELEALNRTMVKKMKLKSILAKQAGTD